MVMTASPVDLSGLAKDDRVAELRRRMASMPGGGLSTAARAGAPVEAPAAASTVASAAAPTVTPVVAAQDAAVAPSAVVPGVPVPDSVASLLPGGVLPAGKVTGVAGSATLQVGLLAAATAAGARCAVVGWPELGVAAVAEQGGRLDCLALIPDAGPDPAAVVSVLLDGLDLVLLGPDVAAVAPSRARVLAGRVRVAGAVLLVGPGWPGAELTLAGRHCRYGGLSAGAGRLSSVSTVVRCAGRAAPPRSAEWVAAG